MLVCIYKCRIIYTSQKTKDFILSFIYFKEIGSLIQSS